ncbi:hypothetical protein [Flavobacterium psychrotolerans]|uniref:Uncharacterized protein n=1 Tax=Flavobacterium psychrotolerans TaxID=2169410 RepID=A0A2U1JH01_9FLAO|nr:hypothetical protein [Flavobacterium psychrotolerans]PWA04218.1 hypothetical protein DB895_12035 [Flavobacterium psychrotolerans]
MTEKFLKAKHWQLFLLTFGIPMLFQVVLMIAMFANIGNGNNSDVSFLFNYMMFFPIIMILLLATQFGWFWSMAIGLQSKVPENVKMKVKKFKIFFFIPLIYLILISIFIGVAASGMMESGKAPSVGLIISLVVIIIPLHLFSMFCIFYSLYFVAKTYKTVELQRQVSFSDFAGEFLMIWFYPIGIWIIQPKINKMIEN